MLETRKIAVDFDGTIVENQYPAIGKERPFALQTLRALQEHGFVLILWTCRVGKELEEAVEFCKKGGVEFYGVNENFDGEINSSKGEGVVRKIDADIYIDDRNYGGLPSWGQIYQDLINGNGNQEDGQKDENGANGRKPGVLNRIVSSLLGH